jgi:hypothetical protein
MTSLHHRVVSSALRAVLTASAMIACGSSSPTTTDAGKTADAGKTTDAGKTADAAKRLDAGHDGSATLVNLDSGAPVASCSACTGTEVCLIAGVEGGRVCPTPTDGGPACTPLMQLTYQCFPRPASCAPSGGSCDCQDAFCPEMVTASCAVSGGQVVVSCIEEAG